MKKTLFCTIEPFLSNFELIESRFWPVWKQGIYIEYYGLFPCSYNYFNN